MRGESTQARSMKGWRTTLLVLGVLLLALGAYVMVDTVKPVKIAGLALWFLLAVVVHDGIIAFVTFGVAFLLRKAGRTLPIAVLAIVQAAQSSCCLPCTRSQSVRRTPPYCPSTTARRW